MNRIPNLSLTSLGLLLTLSGVCLRAASDSASANANSNANSTATSATNGTSSAGNSSGNSAPPANANAKKGKGAPSAQHGLGLARIKKDGAQSHSDTIVDSKASVSDLTAHGNAGAAMITRQNLDILTIAPGKVWTSALRGGLNDTTYVSFLVYGSIGTTINVGAANLMIAEGATKGYAQIRLGSQVGAGKVQWRSFGGPVKVEYFEGAPLASLPVLTVRLNPSGHIWDLYVGNHLAATDLALIDLPAGSSKQFSVQASSQGAWVCGLIDSDENPHFVDTNNNGIDDEFEKAQLGNSILPTNAPATDRTQLAVKWQKSLSGIAGKGVAMRRPLPDGVVPPVK